MTITSVKGRVIVAMLLLLLLLTPVCVFADNDDEVPETEAPVTAAEKNDEASAPDKGEEITQETQPKQDIQEPAPTGTVEAASEVEQSDQDALAEPNLTEESSDEDVADAPEPSDPPQTDPPEIAREEKKDDVSAPAVTSPSPEPYEAMIERIRNSKNRNVIDLSDLGISEEEDDDIIEALVNAGYYDFTLIYEDGKLAGIEFETAGNGSPRKLKAPAKSKTAPTEAVRESVDEGDAEETEVETLQETEPEIREIQDAADASEPDSKEPVPESSNRVEGALDIMGLCIILIAGIAKVLA